jgi:hypothetical protein
MLRVLLDHHPTDKVSPRQFPSRPADDHARRRRNKKSRSKFQILTVEVERTADLRRSHPWWWVPNERPAMGVLIELAYPFAETFALVLAWLVLVFFAVGAIALFAN